MSLNTAGSPDNSSQRLLGSFGPGSSGPQDIPTAGDPIGHTLVSLTVAPVPVFFGSVYWLVLKPVIPNDTYFWNDSIWATTAPGGVQFSSNDVTWQPVVPDTNILPAFRITA